MSVFDHPEFDQHESIHYFDAPAAGLRAIIAIHSTALGPAAGGCRLWHYANDNDALTDALRLSRGMTYKNAVAGLSFGGGKSVILAKAGAKRSAAQFNAFGRAVDSLAGRYVTAEDVGVTVEDMREVRKQTRFVSGLPQDGDNAGGDPSPWTALGVFLAIETAVRTRLDRENLQGVRVAVQGIGHVGLALCRLLHRAGADLLVADVNQDNLQTVAAEMPVNVLSPAEIVFADADVLAPCALGGILTADSIGNIRAKIIAGAANNQLANATDGERLSARDILYAPDYVVNAGGIISVAREYFGTGSAEQVRQDVGRIPERLQAIFNEAADTGRPTNEIADKLARSIVAAAASQKH